MDIVHNFKINTTADELYEALATQKGIQGWWCNDCNIAQKEGSVSKMRFDKEGTIVEMHFRIDTLEPGEKLSWTCIKNPNPAWLNTRLHFELKQTQEGVDFTFAHSNWDPKWKGEPQYEMVKETWGHFMESLKNYCEEGVGKPW